METTRADLLQERGQRIVAARKAEGMTQAQMADLLEVDAMTVSRWERGLSDPGSHYLGEIARLAKVTADWILTGVAVPVADPTEAA